MNKEETMKRLEEAQILPVATTQDLKGIPSWVSEEKLTEYLQDFVKPTGTCWLCEKELYIEWGLAHGVARCTNCGIDSRVYHYLKDNDGQERKLEISLQYHPKNYSVQ
jgi:hypothetical protein